MGRGKAELRCRHAGPCDATAIRQPSRLMGRAMLRPLGNPRVCCELSA